MGMEDKMDSTNEMETYYNVKTVGDLANLLKLFPQNAKIVGMWEGISNNIQRVIYDESGFEVLLDVDVP